MFDKIPPSAGIRVVGLSFSGQNRRPVQKRAIDNIAMTSDPSGISDAKVDIFIFEIKDLLCRNIGPNHIPTVYMNNSLRFSCGARGIQDVEWGF